MKRHSLSARALTAALTAFLVMGVTVPVIAAEDTNQPVSVLANDGGNASETVGNITIAKDDASVGDTAFAASVTAAQGSQAELNVEGSINTASESGTAGIGYGADAKAFGGSAELNVSGDVQVSGEDVFFFFFQTMAGDGTAHIAIGGDLTVSSGSGYGVYMEGGSSDETKSSQSFVEIGGDLTVENQGYAAGVAAHGKDILQAVAIGGDVTVSSEEYDAVALSTGGLDAVTNIRVGGDVSSSGTGLEIISMEDAAAQIDVMIEGTLSAKENPILLTGEKGKTQVQLTAWQIVPNADGKIVVCDEGLEDMAAELESNILYLIRLEQPQAGGSVALEGVSESRMLDAAYEGDTVTLKATVQDGYRLAGAYNGTTALTLLDADGNYYIVVPKGGGVSLSVLLEKIQSGDIPVAPAAPAAQPAAAEEETPEAEKNLIEEYAFTANDSDAKISFYDDMTVTIVLPDGTEVQGTFAFEDGKLTFNGIELTITIDEEDGSYHCVYTLADGTEIEFVLSAEFVEILKNASV